MPVSAQTLKILMDAGIAGDALLEVVASIDADHSAAPRSAAAERQRRYRERNRNDRYVTRDAAPLDKEIPPTPPKENSTPLTPTTEANASSVAPKPGPKAAQSQFDEFWEAYPQRDGANPKEPALKLFKAHLRSGVTAETMIGAARRYAEGLAAKGQIKTPLVAQARTWLNQKRYGDYPEQTAVTATAGVSGGFVAAPGSLQWQAWFDHKRHIGERTALMEAQARDGKGYATPTEWPPAATATAA